MNIVTFNSAHPSHTVAKRKPHYFYRKDTFGLESFGRKAENLEIRPIGRKRRGSTFITISRNVAGAAALSGLIFACPGFPSRDFPARV